MNSPLFLTKEEYYRYYGVSMPFERFVYTCAENSIRLDVIQPRVFAERMNTVLFANVMRILLLLFVAFFIVIPLVCYLQNNWYLLFGYTSFFFLPPLLCQIIVRSRNPSLIFLLIIFIELVIASIMIYFFGVFNVWAFIVLTVLYMTFTLSISELVYESLAKKILIRSYEKYYEAVQGGIVQVYYRSINPYE
jgi:hypothetical protein